MFMPDTAIVSHQPTVSETSLATRQEIVRLDQAGWTAAAIAAELGVSQRTVARWRRRFRREGPAGLAYRSRRPRTRVSHATAEVIVARIAAIRAAHPGWGARLIQRQLRLEGVRPLPSERTVHAWLRRLGAALVRPRAHKSTGWRQPPRERDDTTWEMDHKEKGGAST